MDTTMSVRCKTMFERGRFFIETGTANGFHTFWDQQQSGIIKFIPSFIFVRIEDLIGRGDRDAAIALWFHACVIADATPSKMLRNMISVAFHVIIAAMAGYAFLHAIL